MKLMLFSNVAVLKENTHLKNFVFSDLKTGRAKIFLEQIRRGGGGGGGRGGEGAMR